MATSLDVLAVHRLCGKSGRTTAVRYAASWPLAVKGNAPSHSFRPTASQSILSLNRHNSDWMLVQRLTFETIPGATALQRDCFPAPFPEELLWSSAHLEEHLRVFPEGQFVAVFDDKVIGSASALIISEENWQAHHDWDTTTGGHFMRNHDPKGTTLYGMDISVHPDYRGQGVGRALYQARFDAVFSLGLARYGTACRIPDYAAWSEAHGGSPIEYCEKVARGEARDRTMTPLLRYGLRYVQVLNDYMDDIESGNSAALLEWKP